MNLRRLPWVSSRTGFNLPFSPSALPKDLLPGIKHIFFLIVVFPPPFLRFGVSLTRNKCPAYLVLSLYVVLSLLPCYGPTPNVMVGSDTPTKKGIGGWDREWCSSWTLCDQDLRFVHHWKVTLSLISSCLFREGKGTSTRKDLRGSILTM